MTVIALPFPSFADRPMKILRPDLSARIRAVNAVRRALSQWDVRVMAQDLMHRGPRPRLRIAAPLPPGLLHLSPFVRREGADTVALLGGVDVCWVPQP